MNNDKDKTISLRELAVVKHYALGKTYGEIGDLLFISAATVRTHLDNVRRKCCRKPMRTVIYWFAKARVI